MDIFPCDIKGLDHLLGQWLTMGQDVEVGLEMLDRRSAHHNAIIGSEARVVHHPPERRFHQRETERLSGGLEILDRF